MVPIAEGESVRKSQAVPEIILIMVPRYVCECVCVFVRVIFQLQFSVVHHLYWLIFYSTGGGETRGRFHHLVLKSVHGEPVLSGVSHSLPGALR